MSIADSFTPADEATRQKKLLELTQDNKFAKVMSIGNSRCGRSIDAVYIGNNRSCVLLCGGVHGSEWITSSLLLLFTKRLCNAISNHSRMAGIAVGRYMLSRGVVIVPCLNPDGTEIAINGVATAGQYTQLVKRLYSRGIWQSNAAGVDLNHNFPAGWNELHELEIKNKITGPSNTRYGGQNPGSEPETEAIIRLCRNVPFRHAIAFHSQGEEIYWKYGDKIPAGTSRIAEILSRSSGYILSEPEGLAVGGGFKDWFITEFERPSYTIEIGKGKNPLPASDLSAIYNKLEKMLTLSIIV